MTIASSTFQQLKCLKYVWGQPVAGTEMNGAEYYRYCCTVFSKDKKCCQWPNSGHGKSSKAPGIVKAKHNTLYFVSNMVTGQLRGVRTSSKAGSHRSGNFQKFSNPEPDPRFGPVLWDSLNRNSGQVQAFDCGDGGRRKGKLEALQSRERQSEDCEAMEMKERWNFGEEFRVFVVQPRDDVNGEILDLGGGRQSLPERSKKHDGKRERDLREAAVHVAAARKATICGPMCYSMVPPTPWKYQLSRSCSVKCHILLA
ncbi:hypothetical protein FB451DRAFT_1173055 [Mycena latifolia]|nr:hypothetical protein FB451DRAFT_1173055 [Mycena latifolia]